MPRSFDRYGDFSLKLQRVARNPSRKNFSLLVNEGLEEFWIFIIHMLDSIFLKSTKLFLFFADFRIG